MVLRRVHIFSPDFFLFLIVRQWVFSMLCQALPSDIVGVSKILRTQDERGKTGEPARLFQPEQSAENSNEKRAAPTLCF